MWSKPLLWHFRQSGKILQTQVPQGFTAFRLILSQIPPRHSQSKRATNCANPGFLVIEFCARCGQTCGHGNFLTISACGESACIAGISRDCGHCMFRLERGATRSQSRRATNCATPQYSIKPHYIIAFWGGFVKRFSLWSKLWVGFKNVQILEKQKHADPCAAGICAAKPYYYTAWAARLQGLFAVRGALFCVLGARTLHGLVLL